jgi:Transposase DDE domain group 1
MTEMTDLVDPSAWPPDTRLIIRREPLHPGAQQSRFHRSTCRYWGHYTASTGGTDAVELDRHTRVHAHVEDNIGRLKNSAATRLPSCDFDANSAWLAVVCMAGALVRWFQLLCLDGRLAKAEPKALGWAIRHPPSRVIRSA